MKKTVKMKWTGIQADSDLEITARRTVGPSRQVMAIESHGSQVHGEHPVEKRLSEITEDLDRFHGGHAAHRAGHCAEDREFPPPFAWFFRNQASKAWRSPRHQ